MPRAAFPGFRLRLTGWGGLFLGFVLILGLAAVNTSNNALMALLGVALASYAVSGAWSREVLGRVEVSVTLPRAIHAGRPALVEVELSNRSRLFPGYGLVVRDREDRWLLFEAYLGRGETRRRTVELSYDRRGWVDVGPWRLEVLLPLGFFLKSKQLLGGERTLIYPRLLPRDRAQQGRGGGRRSRVALDGRGREGDVIQLRDFREGDEKRQIHWKQSARQQRLIAVDRQRQSAEPVLLVLDPRVGDPADPVLLDRFERLVSEVATAVVHRLERGHAVGLVVGSTTHGPVHHPAQAGSLLRPLAEVQAMPADAPGPLPVAGDAIAFRVAEGP